MDSSSFNEKLRLKQLELETLLEITNSLLEYEDVQQLLQEILYRTCSILDASSGFILTEEKQSDLLQPRTTFNIDDSLVSSILFNKKKGLFADLQSQQGKSAILSLDKGVLLKLGKEFSMVAALTDKKKVIGAIILLDKEQRQGKSAFTQEDQSMLLAIAVQASIAYSNTALLDSLIESQRFNKSVMDSIHAGVITTNLFGEIDLVNQAAINILRISREDLIGNHYEIIFEKDALLLDMLHTVEAESCILKEANHTLQCGLNQALVNLSVSPLVDENRSSIGLVIALEDISHLDKIKSTFKKYVSKQIVDKILQNEDLLNLGGQEIEVTTLFSDVRGFTSMSERMEAIDVVKTLNEYFDIMIDVVFKYNGTLDKIIGDALMVIYGAPISGDDDAERAVRTAIEMQQQLAKLNQVRRERGQEPLEIGIGINTGKVIAGNIGSKEQMNYTVIGDAVNLSSRLCSYARPGQIVVSQNIQSTLADSPQFAFTALAPIAVKGKSGLIPVHEVTYFKNDLSATLDEKYQLMEDFLLKNLPAHLVYHSIDHIRDVVKWAQFHGKHEQLTNEEMHLLTAAAWLHDIGYIWDENNHEERGCQFVKENLPFWDFDKTQVDRICGMIMATKIPQTPSNILEEILCDADLDYLGRDDYRSVSERLRNEVAKKNLLSDDEWKDVQLRFFVKHHYFTNSAKKTRAIGKENNYQQIINDYGRSKA